MFLLVPVVCVCVFQPTVEHSDALWLIHVVLEKRLFNRRFYYADIFAFTALTLLVGCQEEDPACKID